ncbi:MAG: hypothetical protein JXX14_05525 [Deltaproteobacteria bacterium]|nr:hypothetical protein [Deltaproteobacteria bacterium]
MMNAKKQLRLALFSQILIVFTACGTEPDQLEDVDTTRAADSSSAGSAVDSESTPLYGDTGSDSEDSDSSTTPDMLELCAKPNITLDEAVLFESETWVRTMLNEIEDSIDYYGRRACVEPCNTEEGCENKPNCTIAEGIQMTVQQSGKGKEITLQADETVWGWSYIHYKSTTSSNSGYNYYDSYSIKWQGKPFKNLAADNSMLYTSHMMIGSTVSRSYIFRYRGCEVSVSADDTGPGWENPYGGYYLERAEINGTIWDYNER